MTSPFNRRRGGEMVCVCIRVSNNTSHCLKKSCLQTWTWNWCFNWVLFLWQPLFWLSFSWIFLYVRTHTVCCSTFPLSNTYTTQTHTEANNWTNIQCQKQTYNHLLKVSLYTRVKAALSWLQIVCKHIKAVLKSNPALTHLNFSEVDLMLGFCANINAASEQL